MPHSVKINDIDVSFPFAPYNVQTEMMRGVITALGECVDGCFESPTGTGKTLSLLCATLAFQEYWWQTHHKKLTIIYASRTHAQLEQVFREFKTTEYATRHTCIILSSRETTCIENVDVAHRSGTDQIAACRILVSRHKCEHKENVDKAGGTIGARTAIRDLEDLGRYAALRTKRQCPYYLARTPTVLREVDLILGPYNYFLDPVGRRSVSVQWQNCVMIFDEAHNIDAFCEDVGGFELAGKVLSGAVVEMESLIRTRMERGDIAGHEDEFRGKADVALPVPEMLQVKSLLGALKSTFDALAKLAADADAGGARKAQRGGALFDWFSDAGLDRSALVWLHLRAESLLDSDGSSLSSLQRIELVHKNLTKVLALGLREPAEFDAFVKAGEGSQREAWEHFYDDAHALRVADESFRFFIARDDRGMPTLHFWCFKPALVISELRRLGVRCLLFASGTLAPLDAFKSALGLDPQSTVTLENDHVVPHERVFVASMRNAPSGKLIDCSYNARAAAFPDVGDALCEVCRIVPDGVLVFFSSYVALEECVKLWHASGLYRRLHQHKPVIAIEARNVDCAVLLAKYDAGIGPGLPGAVLLAVCRGRLSEGMDFSDSRARACVLVGVPYPSYFDLRVVAKRAFLDEGLPLTSGTRWYNQAAFRAANQAVGRVLRHKDDFGAILMLDHRFEGSNAQLSKWLRPMFRAFERSDDVLTQLSAFFTRNAVPHAVAAAAAAESKRARVALEIESRSSSSFRGSLAVLTKADAAVVEARKQTQHVLPGARPLQTSFAVNRASLGIRAIASSPAAAAAPSMAPTSLAAVTTADRLAVYSGEAQLDANAYMLLVRKALGKDEYNEFLALLGRLKKAEARAAPGLRAKLEMLFKGVEGGPTLISRFLQSLPSS